MYRLQLQTFIYSLMHGEGCRDTAAGAQKWQVDNIFTYSFVSTPVAQHGNLQHVCSGGGGGGVGGEGNVVTHRVLFRHVVVVSNHKIYALVYHHSHVLPPQNPKVHSHPATLPSVDQNPFLAGIARWRALHARIYSNSHLALLVLARKVESLRLQVRSKSTCTDTQNKFHQRLLASFRCYAVACIQFKKKKRYCMHASTFPKTRLSVSNIS